MSADKPWKKPRETWEEGVNFAPLATTCQARKGSSSRVVDEVEIAGSGQGLNSSGLIRTDLHSRKSRLPGESPSKRTAQCRQYRPNDTDSHASLL